jgi:hypothetical protein
MTFVRHVPIMHFHHPDRACWLWALMLRRCISDEKRAFRFYRMRGEQDRRVLQFWAWSVQFTWQEEGRYRDHAHRKRSKLARLFGVDFD